MENEFKDKIILITGGTGSIGTALIEKLLKYSPRQIRVFSRDESKQYYLQEKLNYPKNLRLFIGDIRDKERLDRAFEDVDIIFHSAALKHVPLCEYNPFEAVKTNIIGSQNIIDVALKNNVTKVVAISTDKAVNPTNIMGTSKLMMEKLFINANYYTKKPKTVFSCVRFGNVAWARGSVLPLWKKQIENNKKIKITNNDMTRFFISINQAANLVLQASKATNGGEIFILKMPSIKVTDLAKTFIDKYYPKNKIDMEIIGDRDGEKLHEALFDDNDVYKTILENENMYAIIPSLEIYNLEKNNNEYSGFKKIDKIKRYTSEHSVDIDKIKNII